MADLQIIPSHLASYQFSAEISNSWYNYRILKMNGSLFIYIGEKSNETFDELAMAIPSDEIIGTTIIGNDSVIDSKEIAMQITRRLKKQVFISCNVRSDNLLKPLLIKRLAEEIKEHPKEF